MGFSGGKDSAAVLAVATRLARREGLRPPVPISMRFGASPESDESGWQERVVAHLQLDDWEQIELPPDEFDWIGPVARRVLGKHGVLFPPSTHWLGPMLQAASGGALLTGFGGDALFARWPWANSQRERRVAKRTLANGLMLAYSTAPHRLRVAALSPKRPWMPDWEWLLPGAKREAERLWVDDRAAEPAHWARRTEWLIGARSRLATLSSIEEIAGRAGVEPVHPLLDPRFLASIAALGGRRGLGDRGTAMAQVFGGLLPAEVLSRHTKATFVSVFWAGPSREFASRWDGNGVPAGLVDCERLRNVWLRPGYKSFYCAPLIQAAWLASSP